MKARHAVLTAILAAGVLLRVWGIPSDLPYLFDPDEHVFVDPAIAMVATGDFNPHYFGHPASTTIYTLAMLYEGYYLAGRAAGVFASPRDIAEKYRTNLTHFYIMGRLMIVLFGTATMLVLYLLAARIADTRAALVAALFLAVSPLHCAYSYRIRADIMMTFFAVLALLFAVRLLERRTAGRITLAGVFAGCAVASKYPGVIVLIPVWLSCCLAARRDGSAGRAWRDIACVSAVSAAVFALWSPYFFLDFAQAYANIVVEARPYHLGHTRLSGIWNYLWYITVPLRKGLGTGIKSQLSWGRHGLH